TVTGTAAGFFVCHVELPPDSGRDGFDAKLGVVLAMALTLLVVLATAHLENADLVVTAVGHHGGRDRGTRNHRRADFHGLAFADHEDLVDGDLGTHVSRYLFYFEFFAGSDAILLAAGFYDRVHGEAPINGWVVQRVAHSAGQV